MVVCLSLREPRGLLSRRFVCVCLHGNKVQKSLFDGVLCGPRVSFPFFHLNVCAVSLSPVLSLCWVPVEPFSAWRKVGVGSIRGGLRGPARGPVIEI